jgi:hypothetical protein
MYTIKETNNKLIITGRYGDLTPHIIHCSNNITDLKNDVANIYIVAEECTNFPRIHLLTDFSEDEALQQISNYLFEIEQTNEPHLIGCSLVEINNLK